MDYERDGSGIVEIPHGLAARPLRILNIILRVSDLEKSLGFYIGALGMQLLRRQDHPSERETRAFLGYLGGAGGSDLELAHNWDRAGPNDIGTGFGHISIAVRDIYASCSELAEQGVKITRVPGRMKFDGALSALIQDPDGYTVELVQSNAFCASNEDET